MIGRAWRIGAIALLSGCDVPDFVPPPAPPVIHRFEVEPFEVAPGAPAQVRWAVTGADTVLLEGLEGPDGSPAPVAATGTRELRAEGSLALGLTARGPGGTQRARATLVVAPPTPEVRIEAFEVAPRRVRPQDPVQIAWRTTGARAVRLLAAGVDQVVPSVGNRVFRLGPGPVRLLAEGAPAPVEAVIELEPVPGAPRIEAFYADPPSILQDETTTLRIRLDGFDRMQVFLREPDGTRRLFVAGEAADFGPQPVWITLLSAPARLGTQVYELVVDNADGQVTDETRVSGTLDPVPEIEALTLTPTVGGPGGDLDVAWRTRGLEDITVSVRGQPTVRPLPPAGQRTFTLRVGDGRVQLTGRNGNQRLRAETFADIRSDWPTLDVLATSRTLDDEVFVSWRVFNAARIELSVDGALVLTSTVPEQAVRLPLPGPRTIQLDAINGLGTTRARRTVPARLFPTIDRFEVDTATVTVGRWVRAAWETTQSAQVRLQAFGVGQRVPARGEIYVRASTPGRQTLDLDATAPGGRFTRSTLLMDVLEVPAGATEREPNDTFSAAGGPFGVLPRQIRGELEPGDVDVFRIDERSDRVAIATGVAPDCPEGAELTLWQDLGPAAPVQIARVQDPAGCPSLDVADAPEAAGWPGPWFVQLRHPGPPQAVLPYRLLVTPTPRRCGDGVVDDREDCDDGPPQDGTGCSATCTFEGRDELEPNDEPGLARLWVGATYTASLWPQDEDWLTFRLAAPGPQTVRFRGEAAPRWARLQLWTLDERRIADTGWAADPTLEGPALVLPAGVYRLRVMAGSGGDGPVRGRYRLER